MTAGERTSVSVTIMKREYRVQCGPDEVEALYAAARYLDGRLREVQSAVGEAVGQDRLAIMAMAALNIVNDYLTASDGQAARLRQLTEKISAAPPLA